MENNKSVWIIVAVVLVVAFFVMPWGGRWGGVCGMMGNYYGSSYNYNSGWGMMSAGGFGIGWIFMLVVIVALVLLIAWLVQQLQKPKTSIGIENNRRRR